MADDTEIASAVREAGASASIDISSVYDREFTDAFRVWAFRLLKPKSVEVPGEFETIGRQLDLLVKERRSTHEKLEMAQELYDQAKATGDEVAAEKWEQAIDTIRTTTPQLAER